MQSSAAFNNETADCATIATMIADCATIVAIERESAISTGSLVMVCKQRSI